MKITYPSPNAKKARIGLHVRPASFKRGAGGLCNATDAVALTKHKTAYSMQKALWLFVILAIIGLVLYAHLQLPFIGIPHAH